MTNSLASKITSRNQSVPEIEEIEGMLHAYRPSLSSTLLDKVADTTWAKQTGTVVIQKPVSTLPRADRSMTLRWSLTVLIIVFVTLLMAFTNIGQILAKSISRFFRVSNENYVTEVVSSTPMPTSSSNYPYDQYILSIEQAETQAGFEIRSLAALPTADWVFHGAKIEPENQGISLFYSLPGKESKINHMEEIYLYVTVQKNDFENREWAETCPKDTIKEVEVNNWPAELEDGSVWQTETEPTPGVTRLWICRVADPGVFMTLRWEETELKYQIDVHQLGLSGEGADMTIPWLTEQDLINLAENLK